MNSKPYQICTRCVMDTSDPDIQFDETGQCNHCRGYFVRAQKELFHGPGGQGRLSKIIREIKSRGAGKPYDCVIGVSGGVDSTMVAYECKKNGLRPLAVHLDNGWNSNLSVHNIEKTLSKLGIELFTYVVDWEEFKDVQLAFIKASVPNLEIPTDHAITALLFQIAAERNIRYIISGSNIETESIMPKKWGYDHRDYRHLRAIHRQFGTVKLKTFPHYNLFDFAYYFLVKKLTFVKILNYAPFHKEKVKTFLTQELGWVDYGGKHFESIFTRFFQGYFLIEKFGFDKRRAHLSNLICSGQTTREKALKELEEPPYPPQLVKEDREFFLKKLGLTEAEFHRILKAEKKEHTEYPSHARIFLQNKFRLLDRARKLALGKYA